MKQEVMQTADGSTTIHIPEWNEQYHSKHGAVQESLHVFIEAGLKHFVQTFGTAIKATEISLLEIGFGTGLNAFLTLLESKNSGELQINYTGVEAYPLPQEIIQQMNYVETAAQAFAYQQHDEMELLQQSFYHLHKGPWEEKYAVNEYFTLFKRKCFFAEIDDTETHDLIYFDAFGARNQPELWNEEIFGQMYKALKSPGILVTYAAKGSARRAMESSGFSTERLPGPPGKREMLRATKM